MKNALFFLPLLLFAVELKAQLGYGGSISSTAIRDLQYEVHKLNTTEGNASYTEGSPYFYEEFKEASLLSKTKSKNNKALVRYNIFNDQMELKDGDEYFCFQKDTNKFYKFDMGEVQFEIIPIKHKNEELTYAEVIAIGNYSFYAKHNVKFFPAQETKGYSDATPPKFESQKPEYYLKTPQGDFIRIKNIKQFAEELPSYSDQVTKYIKSNKLKFKKVEDLKELIGFVNKQAAN